MDAENLNIIMDDEVNETFVVDSDGKAEYCLKKIKKAQAEHDRLVELAMGEINELENKIEELDKHLENETGYFKTLLYRYFETVEKKETKTQQSYKLLSGSLVFKKPAVKIVKPDDDVLVKYLEASQPELVKTVKCPAWGDLKKNLTINEDGTVTDMSTGEVLDFVSTEETEGSFDIK